MININNVVKTYYDGMNKTEVLKGVNLMVSEGETVALMGRSGSGDGGDVKQREDANDQS